MIRVSLSTTEGAVHLEQGAASRLPDYDAAATYAKGEGVQRRGVPWCCAADGTTGVEPGTNPAKWATVHRRAGR